MTKPSGVLTLCSSVMPEVAKPFCDSAARASDWLMPTTLGMAISWTVLVGAMELDEPVDAVEEGCSVLAGSVASPPPNAPAFSPKRTPQTAMSTTAMTPATIAMTLYGFLPDGLAGEGVGGGA